MQRLLLALALTCAACASVRHSYDFRPSPAEVVVADVARVLIDIPGAVRADEERDGAPHMEVRLRLESRANEVLLFEPAHCTLIGSNLEPFGAPRDAAPLELAPGGEATVTLLMPFPSGMSLRAPEIEGAVFSFRLTGAQLEYESSATFERLWRVPERPFGPSFGFGVGYTFVGCD